MCLWYSSKWCYSYKSIILVSKSCNLNQSQLGPVIQTELYALAALIMDTCTVPRGLRENLSEPSRHPHDNVTGGNMKNEW